MTGPQFLLVYAVLAVIAMAALLWIIDRREAALDGPVSELPQDPYEIAFLRGGAEEAIRVAILSLIDRRIILEENGILHNSGDKTTQYVSNPLDIAIIKCCDVESTPKLLFKDNLVLEACMKYEVELSSNGLLINDMIRDLRVMPFITISFIMIVISALRIGNALLHGRHNINFLIYLTILTLFLIFRIYNNKNTRKGWKTLEKLSVLFADLRRRASSITPGGTSADAVLLAAVFGMKALPVDYFPSVGRLFPDPKKEGGGGGCGGCGGCGGGGCGGGCGG